jgi:hypothetical protein
MTLFAILIVVLIVLKLVVQLALEQLNQRNVRAHAQAVPESFKYIIDEALNTRLPKAGCISSNLPTTRLCCC